MRLFLISPKFCPNYWIVVRLSWMRPVYSSSEKWCVVGHVDEWWVIPCYGSLLMLTPHRRNNRHHLHEAKQVGRIMNCNCNVFRIPLSEQKFEKSHKINQLLVTCWTGHVQISQLHSTQYKLSSAIITWYCNFGDGYASEPLIFFQSTTNQL